MNSVNEELWRKYGENVFMAMPYADEVIVTAQGCTLYDADGKEFLDLAAGMFCCVLGHNHPKFVDRIVGQIKTLLHTGTQFLSPAVLEAGHKLTQVAPGQLHKAIFLSTGTEANEFALRVAKAYTGRTGIMGLSRGYYGTSVATKSCSSLASHRLRDSLPTVPESVRLPITPQCVSCFSTPAGANCQLACLADVESWIGDWSNIAAVIVEPVLSAGGMLFPPGGYLKRLRELAHANGALFIVDEAQTGFGRTGKWFAIEHHDAEPDILTMSKSIGNGFPVAAVLATDKIADDVVAKGLWNLSSHQSDPVAATAVAAIIDIVQEEGLVERARESGEYFMSALRALSDKCPAIANVRGQGLMIGFDLVPGDGEQSAAMVNDFMFGCRRRGVHLTYGFGGVNFRIIPPLIITRAEMDRAVQVIEESLRSALAGGAANRADWPKNPYTKQLFEKPYWKRLGHFFWHSSPSDVVAKGREVVKGRFGRRG